MTPGLHPERLPRTPETPLAGRFAAAHRGKVPPKGSTNPDSLLDAGVFIPPLDEARTP